MQIGFTRVALADVKSDIARHLESLPGPTEEFFEKHVRDSSHYVISAQGARIGLAAIHRGSLITQFSIESAYRRHAQAAFQALRKLEYVREAFVPTCDELYLSHAIDDYRQLHKQAYFFEAAAGSRDVVGTGRYALKVATNEDEGLIREQSADLFGDVGQRITRGELFVTERAGVRVGYGVLAKSLFQRGVAGVGMFTHEAFRGTGVGAATIGLLLDECARRELRAVAGCWYHNHASKRTLERAGMVTRTRLLKVEY
jgi:GNAT superfamily N-acetyltransferase